MQGKVSRLADFGAFVELLPGVDGLIHISEMSWAKKIKKPSDLLKTGEMVEAVVLGVNAAERRISLGLKQALGDPWEDAVKKYPRGSGRRRAGDQPDQLRLLRRSGRRHRRA